MTMDVSPCNTNSTGDNSNNSSISRSNHTSHHDVNLEIVSTAPCCEKSDDDGEIVDPKDIRNFDVLLHPPVEELRLEAGHVGNHRFRVTLDIHRPAFLTSFSKQDAIAESIVETISQKCVPNGRFLEAVPSGKWKIIGNGAKALELVKTALRLTALPTEQRHTLTTPHAPLEAPHHPALTAPIDSTASNSAEEAPKSILLSRGSSLSPTARNGRHAEEGFQAKSSCPPLYHSSDTDGDDAEEDVSHRYDVGANGNIPTEEKKRRRRSSLLRRSVGNYSSMPNIGYLLQEEDGKKQPRRDDGVELASLSEYDVYCRKTPHFCILPTDNVGNNRIRVMMDMQRVPYMDPTTTYPQKIFAVKEVLFQVLHGRKCPGRFMCEEDGLWYELTLLEAKDLVFYCLEHGNNNNNNSDGVDEDGNMACVGPNNVVISAGLEVPPAVPNSVTSEVSPSLPMVRYETGMPVWRMMNLGPSNAPPPPPFADEMRSAAIESLKARKQKKTVTSSLEQETIEELQRHIRSRATTTDS